MDHNKQMFCWKLMGEHTNTCASLMNWYVSQIKYNMLISIYAKHLSHCALNQNVKFVENEIQPTILGSATITRPRNIETGECEIMEV